MTHPGDNGHIPMKTSRVRRAQWKRSHHEIQIRILKPAMDLAQNQSQVRSQVVNLIIRSEAKIRRMVFWKDQRVKWRQGRERNEADEMTRFVNDPPLVRQFLLQRHAKQTLRIL